MDEERHRRGELSASRRRSGLAVGLLALWTVGALAPGADSQQDRRNSAGQRLFRPLLAADEGLAARAQPDGRLLIVFYFTDDPDHAIELARGFARSRPNGEPEPIKGLPLALDTTADPQFAAWEAHPPAGIFLTQEPDAETLARIVSYGIEHGVITFSPFEGHCEQGILGGVSVEAQVRPSINRGTLAASKIHLKDFFQQVARTCE